MKHLNNEVQVGYADERETGDLFDAIKHGLTPANTDLP